MINPENVSFTDILYFFLIDIFEVNTEAVLYKSPPKSFK